MNSYRESGAVGQISGANTPQRETEIPALVSRLQRVLNELCSATEQLARKIEPVLENVPEATPNQKEVPERQPMSQLGLALHESVLLGDSVLRQVRGLTHRVAL